MKNVSSGSTDTEWSSRGGEPEPEHEALNHPKSASGSSLTDNEPHSVDGGRSLGIGISTEEDTRQSSPSQGDSESALGLETAHTSRGESRNQDETVNDSVPATEDAQTKRSDGPTPDCSKLTARTELTEHQPRVRAHILSTRLRTRGLTSQFRVYRDL